MSKYTKTHFQKDLFKLSKLIDNYNAKGGAKNKSGAKRSFKVVEVNGKSVTPYGDYKISQKTNLLVQKKQLQKL